MGLISGNDSPSDYNLAGPNTSIQASDVLNSRSTDDFPGAEECLPQSTVDGMTSKSYSRRTNIHGLHSRGSRTPRPAGIRADHPDGALHRSSLTAGLYLPGHQHDKAPSSPPGASGHSSKTTTEPPPNFTPHHRQSHRLSEGLTGFLIF